MRIGFIVDNEFNHDPRVGNEAKAVQRAGHEVRVLCLNYGKYRNREIVGGIEVTRIPIRLKWKNILFGFTNTLPVYHAFWARHITRFIRRERLDAIHVADLYMARSGYLAKKRTGVKLIVDLKENYPAAVVNYEWTKSPLKRLIARPLRWRKLEPAYLGYADRIVTMCDVLKEVLVKRYSWLDPVRIYTYMNVPVTEFLLAQPIREVIPQAPGFYTVIYFGGIAIRRGILTVIAAMESLRAMGEKVRFLAVGPVDTPEKALFARYLEHPGYHDCIIWVPWITLDELPSYICAADAGLSPILKSEQHDTTVANKMFQYSLFGKPILVSDCEPQVRIIRADKSGLVHRSDDPDEMVKQILYLKNHPEEARRMGENGRQAVLEKYNLMAGSKELIALYNDL